MKTAFLFSLLLCSICLANISYAGVGLQKFWIETEVSSDIPALVLAQLIEAGNKRCTYGSVLVTPPEVTSSFGQSWDDRANGRAAHNIIIASAMLQCIDV